MLINESEDILLPHIREQILSSSQLLRQIFIIDCRIRCIRYPLRLDQRRSLSHNQHIQEHRTTTYTLVLGNQQPLMLSSPRGGRRKKRIPLQMFISIPTTKRLISSLHWVGMAQFCTLLPSSQQAELFLPSSALQWGHLVS